MGFFLSLWVFNGFSVLLRVLLEAHLLSCGSLWVLMGFCMLLRVFMGSSVLL